GRVVLDINGLGSVMCRLQAFEVFVEGLGHFVGQIIGYILVRDQEVGNGSRRRVVVLAVVGAGRDGGGQIGGITDVFNDFFGNGNNDDVNGGGQVADGADTQAGRLQRGVELAVFHEFDGFAKGQVFDFGEVVVTEAGSLEYRTGVEFGARAGSTDRNPLALEVFNGFDAGIGTGHNLDVVVVGGGKAAQLVEFFRETGFFIAIPGVRYGVRQGKGQLAALCL